MNDSQEWVYIESPTTNYLSPENLETLMWGMMRLEPFISPRGRPPMAREAFGMLTLTRYESGLRVSEGLKLVKSDLQLKHRIMTLRDAKTGKKIFKTSNIPSKYTLPQKAEKLPQKTTITPMLVPLLKAYTEDLDEDDLLFPTNRQTTWRYEKDAGRLAGLEIFEEHNIRNIEGIWTHLMRKSCSKRMQQLGASRELRMLKLRHADKDAHDTYDKVDINTLLKWEAEHLPADSNTLLLAKEIVA